MERIIFIAAAVLGLILVANERPSKPVRSTVSEVPNVAVEVKDEALEHIRKVSKRANAKCGGFVYAPMI